MKQIPELDLISITNKNQQAETLGRERNTTTRRCIKADGKYNNTIKKEKKIRHHDQLTHTFISQDDKLPPKNIFKY